MPSFDIVSELDLQEVDNAVNQAEKEIAQRFDFRGSGSTIEFDRKNKIIKMGSNSEDKLETIYSVLQSKAIKRGLDIQCFEKDKVIPAGGMAVKQNITMKEGIDKELGKKINKHIKDLKIKVQSSLQDDKVRVTGKNRDDLQSVMGSVKTAGFGIPLQFINFRD